MNITDDMVILPPKTSDDSFSMEILKDLVSQGYSGNTLIEKFAEERLNIKKAVSILIEEADAIAEGNRASITTKELFGED